ncbi:MAG: YitT family protein [Acutalibacteraceae bacterium]|nr:YitT family protein [Acutalibacteraceae bacterium]
MKKQFLKSLIDIVFYVVGAVIYSAAVPLFISPAHISPGGFTGISLIINYLTGFPVGVTVLLLNIPLILISLKKLGIYFIARTAFATVIVSVTLDVCEKYVKAFSGDTILCALFGGIMTGLGLGMIIHRGATTGGVDIIAKLINGKHPHISVGKIILISDAVVIILSALCYRDVSSVLYSAVTVFVTSLVLDKILYGADKGKLIYIITDNSTEISKEIIGKVSRGVTKLTATGGYTGENREMLMCALRPHEVSKVQAIIKEKDKNAFVIICEAGEILGFGFKR